MRMAMSRPWMAGLIWLAFSAAPVSAHPVAPTTGVDTPHGIDQIPIPISPTIPRMDKPGTTQTGNRPVQSEADGERVTDLPLGMAPAYLVGDIDEDGIIGREDAGLMDGLIGAPRDGLAAVACAAAADIDMDGNITVNDKRLLDTMIQDGPRRSGVLYDSTILPCGHSRAFIAFSQNRVCDAPLSVHLLGKTAARLISWDGGEVKQGKSWRNLRIGYSPKTLEKKTPAILLSLGGNSFVYWLSSFCALERSDEEGEKDWSLTPGHTLNEDNRPTAWGEEIDGIKTCPQIDKGCEALIVDLLASSELWQEPDAMETKTALEGVGCHVEYAAPRFVKIPPRPPLQGGVAPMGGNFSNGQYEAVRRQIEGYEALVNDVIRRNTDAWSEVQAKIKAHRDRVRLGAALAYQLVNGHGSESVGGGCGQWGTGYDTSAGTLTRDGFHNGNYLAMHGNVCTAVTEDRSCYSGLSAMGLDFLNNLGLVSCGGKSRPRHQYHAAYDADMVITTASGQQSCTMFTMTKQDYDIARLIRNGGEDDGYRSLAAAFDKSGVHDEASGKYMDAGYKRIPAVCPGHITEY